MTLIELNEGSVPQVMHPSTKETKAAFAKKCTNGRRWDNCDLNTIDDTDYRTRPIIYKGSFWYDNKTNKKSKIPQEQLKDPEKKITFEFEGDMNNETKRIKVNDKLRLEITDDDMKLIKNAIGEDCRIEGYSIPPGFRNAEKNVNIHVGVGRTGGDEWKRLDPDDLKPN